MRVHRAYDGLQWIYGTAFDYDSGTDSWYYVKPDEKVLMVGKPEPQIGWQDKNGKEVYLNDIIGNGKRRGIIRFERGEYFVDWLDGEFYTSRLAFLSTYEVISNVTEERL